MQRHILHVEVTSFPVAVERVVDPGLKDRPVVVAPASGVRSLVHAVSLEAGREGIAPGMPLARALRRCRGLVVLPPNPQLYERASLAMGKIFGRYSPLVEPARHGHAFLDLSGTGRLFGPARDTALRIQREIGGELRLAATLGVASNKLVSKVASGVVAPPPDTRPGIENVVSGFEERFLAPLPVERLPGVGEKISGELVDYNVRLVGELALIPLGHLVMAFGRVGVALQQKARGIDSSPVCPPRKKPVMEEIENLASDSNDSPFLLALVYRLVERGGRRLRAAGQVAGKISLRVRHADHREAAAAVRLPRETDLDPVLFTALRPAFEKLMERRVRVRWLSLSLQDLAGAPAQLSLFPSASSSSPRTASLLTALDSLRTKYGEKAVCFGMGVSEEHQRKGPGSTGTVADGLLLPARRVS